MLFMHMLANETVKLSRHRELFKLGIWLSNGCLLCHCTAGSRSQAKSEFEQLSVFSEFHRLIKVAKECVRWEF